MISYFDGMLYGLVFILALGPAFFALFQTALKNGFKRAMLVSLGVNMSDAIAVSLILLGMKSFLEDQRFEYWLGIVGVVVLISFGCYSLFKKGGMEKIKESKNRRLVSFWLKGFLLNGLNPIIVLSWVGVVGGVSSLGYSTEEQFWFFGGVFSTVLLLDIVKTLMITRLHSIINDRFVRVTNRLIGAVFITFGLALAYVIMT